MRVRFVIYRGYLLLSLSLSRESQKLQHCSTLAFYIYNVFTHCIEIHCVTSATILL